MQQRADGVGGNWERCSEKVVVRGGRGYFGAEIYHEEDARRCILLLPAVLRLQDVSKNEHRLVAGKESSAAEILFLTIIVARQ